MKIELGDKKVFICSNCYKKMISGDEPSEIMIESYDEFGLPSRIHYTKEERQIAGLDEEEYRRYLKHPSLKGTYFILTYYSFSTVENNGPIKIGYSTDIATRIRDLNYGSPEKLILLYIERGEKDKERILHKRFKKYRMKGEWFENCKEIRDYIDERLEENLKNKERMMMIK